MKKKTLICLAFLLLLSGCDNKNEQVSDEKISVPETLEQISSTNGKTTRDYGNKNMLEGFWVKENVSGGDKWYKYIPMLPEKLAGIYDFEDGELNKSMKSYITYNCPEGTKDSKIEAAGTYSGYYTIPQLGLNANPKDEESEELGVMRSTTSFAFGQGDDNQNTLFSYDVGCITFALYKELYKDFPKIKMQIYGATEEQMTKELGDLSTWSSTDYSEYIKKCKENDYKDFKLLSEKEITDSGIFYIDYHSMSEEYNYMQYFIVLRFSESAACGYYMNGQCTYNIEDVQAYNIWKQENKGKYIAGK